MRTIIILILLLTVSGAVIADQDCLKAGGYYDSAVARQVCRNANANERIANALEQIAEALRK